MPSKSPRVTALLAAGDCTDQQFDPVHFVTATETIIRRLGFGAVLIFLPAMMIARLTEITTRSMNIPGSLFNAMEAEFFLLFAFLIAGSAAVNDAHVRVDIFRDRFGPRARAWIELLGTIVFVIPFAFVVIWYGSVLVESAWSANESAAIALGAPVRWIIILATPLGIGLLALAIICRTIRHVGFLLGRTSAP